MGGEAFSARTVFGAAGQRWAGLVHLPLEQVLTSAHAKALVHLVSGPNGPSLNTDETNIQWARRLCFQLSGECLGSFSFWEGLAGKMVRKNVMTPITGTCSGAVTSLWQGPLSFVKQTFCP